MPKHIRPDHPWFEVRGLALRKARAVRDCDMAEHRTGWEGAIQQGDAYVWLPHAHLNVCLAHFSPEDIVDGPVHPDSPSGRSADKSRRGEAD